MRYQIKAVYVECFAKKYSNPYEFVNAIACNPNHAFWGSGGAGREFAREILSKSHSWYWLSCHVDDYALFIEDEMRKKLSLWIWNTYFEKSTLAYHLDSTESAARWLMDRYVNELKNLFDDSYDNHIKPIKFISYEEKQC
ncbi:hypothetical protein [Sulfuricurvum sp.]|uniref:hypothetical protein n=1 Tax=Sulfuricurvum sp. TaxID=2025608 RepID=UPI002636D4F4|nr:hypothetical protein [Sulfuricurvum sp.]MDD2838505.1 hypothetical protein [Sulfuricurvum sp.]MDD3597427.1 hypothetical protein [Sulfuricurvum sp.]